MIGIDEGPDDLDSSRAIAKLLMRRGGSVVKKISLKASLPRKEQRLFGNMSDSILFCEYVKIIMVHSHQ